MNGTNDSKNDLKEQKSGETNDTSEQNGSARAKPSADEVSDATKKATENDRTVA